MCARVREGKRQDLQALLSARGLAARARPSWTFRGPRGTTARRPRWRCASSSAGKDSEFPVTVDAAVMQAGATEAAQVVGPRAGGRVPAAAQGTLKDVTLNRDGLTPLEIVGR